MSFRCLQSKAMKILQSVLKIFATLACIAMFGCGGIEPQFYPLDNTVKTDAPRSANQVELFITKKPTWQYKELGMVTYSTPASFSNEPQIYQMLRQKAGEIGADGLIIMDSQTNVEQMLRLTLDFYGNPVESERSRTYIKYRGMAIVKVK